MHSTNSMWNSLCNLQNQIQIQFRPYILGYFKMIPREHNATINKGSIRPLNFHFEDKMLQEKQTQSSPLDVSNKTDMKNSHCHMDTY